MYQLTKSAFVVRVSDGALIPADPSNTDHADYLKWLDAGNTPQPVDAPSIDQMKAASLVEVRSLRASFFPALAGLQSEALARGNAADALAIAAVQQGARDITGTDLTGCVSKADIDARFFAGWVALITHAPASVVTAFRALKS